MERDIQEKTKLYKKIVENLKKYEIDKKNKYEYIDNVVISTRVK